MWRIATILSYRGINRHFPTRLLFYPKTKKAKNVQVHRMGWHAVSSDDANTVKTLQ
jgi:hypothetical protein